MGVNLQVNTQTTPNYSSRISVTNCTDCRTKRAAAKAFATLGVLTLVGALIFGSVSLMAVGAVLFVAGMLINIGSCISCKPLRHVPRAHINSYYSLPQPPPTFVPRQSRQAYPAPSFVPQPSAPMDARGYGAGAAAFARRDGTSEIRHGSGNLARAQGDSHQQGFSPIRN